jgi:hypothetical protein
MSKARSGGGITSNKVKPSRYSKPELKSRAVAPVFAGQLGSHFGNHITTPNKTGRSATVSMDAGRARLLL